MGTICRVVAVDGFGKEDVVIFFSHVPSYRQSSASRTPNCGQRIRSPRGRRWQCRVSLYRDE